MGKTKHRKGHKEKLQRYKTNKKIEQDNFKKKMIENYQRMQQEALAAREAHTSTEEVSGPEINIDELNQVEDWESVDIQSVENSEINVEDVVVEDVVVENVENIKNDNDNK